MAEKSVPIGSTLAELLRMPIELAQDIQETVVPDFQRQIKDLPDIIRQNVRFNVDSFRQLPEQFRAGMKTDASNLPMLITKAASPVPLLSPQEIQEKSQAVQVIELPPPITKGISGPLDFNKVIEERTQAFADYTAKINANKGK